MAIKKKKPQKTTNFDKDMEKSELLYVTDGDINGTATVENSLAVPQNVRITI